MLYGHIEDVLSPAEELLWNAFYSIEPFGDEIHYLAEIESGVKKWRSPHLPSECYLNQPLEDVDMTQRGKEIADTLTAMARDYLLAEGKDLDKMIEEAKQQSGKI